MKREPDKQSDLDKTLKDTFPASDPLPPVSKDKGPSKHDEAARDEALDETFPASDPLPPNPGTSPRPDGD